MSFLQILIIVFIIFVLGRVMTKYTKQDINFREWLTWSVFWLVVGVAAALPKTTDIIASKLGLATGRGVDLAVYISIPVLFYIIFRLFAKIDRLEEDITKVVRHIALQDKSEKQKD